MAWSIVDEDPADMLRGTVGGLEDSKLAATCSCCCCCCILLANPASPPASLADATAEVAAPALVGVSVVALPPARWRAEYEESGDSSLCPGLPSSGGCCCPPARDGEGTGPGHAQVGGHVFVRSLLCAWQQCHYKLEWRR
eukprot:scaffold50168_cov22-Tisochrysis_lutea.AAC.3